MISWKPSHLALSPGRARPGPALPALPSSAEQGGSCGVHKQGMPEGLRLGEVVRIFQSVSDKSACLKKYVYGFGTQQESLPFEGALGACTGCSSSGSSRDEP